MWSRKKRRPNVAIQTLIGAGTEVHGDLRFAEGCHVDGLIKGDVIGRTEESSLLSVSERGRIEGGISAPYVVLNGTVHGDVYAHEWLELGSSACVTGNVHYRLLEMAIGAEINGNLVHVSPEQRMLAHDPAPPALEVGSAALSAAAGD